MPPFQKRVNRYQQNRTNLAQNKKIQQKIITLSPSFQEEVKKLLSANQVSQRVKALHALSNHPDARHAVRFIENSLMDEDETVRANAIHALEKLKAKNSIQKIEQMLNDPHERVQLAAIHALTSLDSRRSTKKIEPLLRSKNHHVRQQAFEYWADATGIPTELYQEQVLDPQFMNLKRAVIRRPQVRTGPPTTLLGGKLFGKAILRTVPKTAMIAWLKALESGVKVEPILKKNGKYRITKLKDGSYRVATHVLAGPSLKAFWESERNRKKYFEETSQQMGAIMGQLDQLKIQHYHLTPKNFVVVIEKGKPVVYAIDFDRAEVL